MKIATWNVNSLNVRLPHVLQWLNEHQPDVLALQELKLDQDKFPHEAIRAAGFQAAWYGQKTYNGVAIIARETPQDVVYGMADFEDPQRRVIAATVNGVRIVNAYCVNGEAVGSEKFAYKKQWFAALQGCLKAELAAHEALVLLGDFNIAPSDADVYDPKKWHEKILCSSEERAWFQALLDLGLHDALRELNPHEPLFTWWDYRMNGFKRDLGLRIDHVLLSEKLMAQAHSYGIDRAARAAERPSDHAPVWVQLRA
ncbi:MAG: exodeoxyribonuclease III [Neisseria sp.]|nr:exodeoxyribonuclease III [Neisseria sp.]